MKLSIFVLLKPVEEFFFFFSKWNYWLFLFLTTRKCNLFTVLFIDHVIYLFIFYSEKLFYYSSLKWYGYPDQNRITNKMKLSMKKNRPCYSSIVYHTLYILFMYKNTNHLIRFYFLLSFNYKTVVRIKTILNHKTIHLIAWNCLYITFAWMLIFAY